MKKIYLITLLILMGWGAAIAQVNSSLTVDFDNPARMSMEIDRSVITIGFTLNDAEGHVALSSPVTVNIKSNVPWALSATVSTDFLGVDNPSSTISCSQLEFKSRLIGSAENVLDQQEEFLGFAKNQAMTVARGNATPNEGLHIVNEYRLKLNLKDPAGRFSLPIVFTLSPSQ
jgi:hypothetical protein